MAAKNYVMEKQGLIQGINLCHQNILNLTKSVELTMKNKGNMRVALGLFSFAIEEYGKLLFFKDCIGKGDTCSVPRFVFSGKKSHNLKFEKALKNLPSNCKKFFELKFVNTPIYEDKTLQVGPHNTNYTFDHGTKIYTIGDFLVDFETRMYCFYLDWNNSGKSWKIITNVHAESLQKTVINFRKHIQKIKIPIYKT